MRDKKSRCMGCMNPLPKERDRCGFCGNSANLKNPSSYLETGTLLSEYYQVGKMTEFTGDTATYIGYDLTQESLITIREFFPEQLSSRKRDGLVSPLMGFEPIFADYFGKFRNQARALARVRGLAGIISIYDIFEEKGTVYTISEYYGNVTLQSKIEKEDYLIWDDFRPLIVPLLTSIATLHSAGIVHLGINPENILIGTDGKLYLTGFCIEEARKVGTKITPSLPTGFAAPEQYSPSLGIGVWSDVYSMATTMFYALTGVRPINASKRDHDGSDLNIPAKVANEMPEYVAMALFNALILDPKKRIRTMTQLRDDLTTPPAVLAMKTAGKREEEAFIERERALAMEEEEEIEEKSDKKQVVLIVLAILILLSLVAGILVLLFGGKNKPAENDSSEVEPTITSTLPQVDTHNVPSVVGQNFYELEDKTLLNDMYVELGGLIYSDLPFGEIISQVPTSDEKAEKGTPMKVFISGGKETVTIPNLSGMDSEEAVKVMEMIGFKVTLKEKESQSYPAGTIAEVEGVGTTARRGTEVVLYVSITPATTEAPTTTTEVPLMHEPLGDLPED